MYRIIKLIGILLWSLVLIVVAFSYTGEKYSNKDNLKGFCDKYNFDPHSLPTSKLDQILSDLNVLQLSHEDNNAQWIDSCIGSVMVELKSRKFENELQKSLHSIDRVNKK